MNHNFKVGDMVRIKFDAPYHGPFADVELEIHEIVKDSVKVIEPPLSINHLWIHSDYIEPAVVPCQFCHDGKPEFGVYNKIIVGLTEGDGLLMGCKIGGVGDVLVINYCPMCGSSLEEH